MKKNKQVVIRMDEELHAKLSKLAEKDKRFLSDYIRIQLQKLLKIN